MLAAGRGQLEMTEQFLYLGANLSVKANNGWTALDWAINFNQPATAELIQNYL